MLFIYTRNPVSVGKQVKGLFRGAFHGKQGIKPDINMQPETKPETRPYKVSKYYCIGIINPKYLV